MFWIPFLTPGKSHTFWETLSGIWNREIEMGHTYFQEGVNISYKVTSPWSAYLLG